MEQNKKISFLEPQPYPQPWQLMTHFVVRCPGFSFDWLTQLHFPETVAATQLYQQHHHRWQQMQHVFAEELFPGLIDKEETLDREKSVFRFWYGLAKKIRRGQMVNEKTMERVRQYGRLPLAAWLEAWQKVCQQRQAAYDDGERLFQEELAAKRHTLYKFVQDDRFREALWLSNPTIYEIGWRTFNRHWQPDHRPAKIKHLERRFYTYLQRFCAKNDTTSFFGPLNYGRFDPTADDTYCDQSQEPIRQRQVFFAYWAVTGVADLIAADPVVRPYLCPQRNPLKRWEPADPEAAALYRFCDGTRNVMALATMRQQPVAAVLTLIEALIEDNWLHLAIPIPPAEANPLDYLCRCVQQLPLTCTRREHWLTILRDLQQTCARYAAADLAQRRRILNDLETHYTNLTGIDGRRGQGKIFQDRTLLYEECLGDIEAFCLGRSHLAHLTHSLTPIAALSATYSHLIRMDLQAVGQSLFARLSPAGEPIPFIHFVTAWRKLYPTLPPLRQAAHLQQQLTHLVAQRDTGEVSRLTAAEVLALCQVPDEPITFSPDILLAASDLAALQAGDYQLVMGEVHHGVQPVGWMLTFVEDRQAWAQQIGQHLPSPSPTHTPANLLFGRRMKTAPPEFPGPSVEASGASRQSQTLALRDLVVEQSQEGSLHLRAPGYDKGLTFYPPTYYVPEPLYAPFACFSYLLVQSVPVDLGQHTPRIEIDQAVYQRQQWQLSTDLLPHLDHTGTSYQLLVDYLDFQAHWHLPQHLFVKTDEEPKPVYIDLHNYFALELLVHLAAQTDTITLVEMCPAPDQLWLQKDDQPFTCELRTVLSTKGI